MITDNYLFFDFMRKVVQLLYLLFFIYFCLCAKKNTFMFNARVFSVQMTFFNMLDPTEEGVLGAIKSQFKDIYLPALKRMDKGWGELAGETGERERSKFLNDIENFILVLESTSSSSNTIDLASCTTFDLNSLKTANDFYNVANSFESMEKIEACIAGWIKQIAQVMRLGL